MSQENQSCLRFSLEETLWFRKGQEVVELISISLDPDITIQENDQYVTIRGSLELTGEYNSTDVSDGSEDEDVSTQKYIERVDVQEEGSCEFSHRFPVDITIPNNRIQSIYDIDVLVESFDYSFPERSCLKLSAELTISGLYGVEQQEDLPEFEEVHRYVGEDVNDDQNSYEDDFIFEAEAKKQQVEENVEEFPKLPTFSYQPIEEDEVDEFQPSWIFEEARNEGSKPLEIEVTQQVVIEQSPSEPMKKQEFMEDESSSSSSSSEDLPKQKKKKKAPKKKSMTLTEFFARKEENSNQARLKMCIVQKGDTLDRLAERYDVSVANLLRVNNLELNQDVYEGQVLYVPAAIAQK